MRASFFDSNVLVYIASGDPANADQAEAAIATGGAISVQVLNEITNIARRKMQMSWADTHTLLDMLRGLPTVHPEGPTPVAGHSSSFGFLSAAHCR
jgi:predicted nucleic acid-binding protein